MPNTLSKTAASRRKGAGSDSLLTALKNGGVLVWLSCLVMGLGNLAAGQIIMGLLFLAVEAGVIVFLAMPNGGL